MQMMYTYVAIEIAAVILPTILLTETYVAVCVFDIYTLKETDGHLVNGVALANRKQILFWKKKQTNALLEDESPNKITLKRRDFYLAYIIRNAKLF